MTGLTNHSAPIATLNRMWRQDHAAVRATKFLGDADVEVVAVSIDGVHCGPQQRVNTDARAERGAVFNVGSEALDQLRATVTFAAADCKPFVGPFRTSRSNSRFALQQHGGRSRRWAAHTRLVQTMQQSRWLIPYFPSPSRSAPIVLATPDPAWLAVRPGWRARNLTRR